MQKVYGACFCSKSRTVCGRAERSSAYSPEQKGPFGGSARASAGKTRNSDSTARAGRGISASKSRQSGRSWEPGPPRLTRSPVGYLAVTSNDFSVSEPRVMTIVHFPAFGMRNAFQERERMDARSE